MWTWICNRFDQQGTASVYPSGALLVVGWNIGRIEWSGVSYICLERPAPVHQRLAGLLPTRWIVFYGHGRLLLDADRSQIHHQSANFGTAGNDAKGYCRSEKSGDFGFPRGLGGDLIPLFTLAIRMETATAVRIARLRARERARFGSRLDPNGDMYAHHEKFICWASDYDDGDIHMRSKAMHDRWQKQLACPLVTVDGNLPMEANLEMIKLYL